jgi:cell division protein FtsQ
VAKDRSPRRRPETTTSPKRTTRGVRWRLVLTVIPLLVVAGATYAALRSPYLTVQEIRVEGAATLDPASIAELSNLDGASMLRLPTDSARMNLVAIPSVKSVSFERQWPQTLTIKVEERIPVAFWSVGGYDYAVDEEGVVLAAGAPNGPAPRIVEQVQGKSLTPGDRVHPDAVAFARRIFTESPRFLDESVEMLEYRSGIGVTVVFHGGMRVTFGDERSYEYKIAVLSELLDNLTRQGVAPKAVDLRFGERVTYE